MREMEEQPKKRSKLPFVFGCLGGGCLAFILVIVGTTIWVLNWVKSVPETNPSVTPVPFVQEEFDQLENRYETFRKNVEAGAQEEFTLTPEEINMALSKWAKEATDAPRVIIEIDGSTATGKASVPITTEDGLQKWINCELAFNVSIKEGRLDLKIKELKVKDKTFGEGGMFAKQIQELSDQALADFNDKPETRKQIEHIESVTIKDGKVHLRIKPGTKLDSITSE